MYIRRFFFFQYHLQLTLKKEKEKGYHTIFSTERIVTAVLHAPIAAFVQRRICTQKSLVSHDMQLSMQVKKKILESRRCSFSIFHSPNFPDQQPPYPGIQLTRQHND
jgi:hypothetical protein